MYQQLRKAASYSTKYPKPTSTSQLSSIHITRNNINQERRSEANTDIKFRYESTPPPPPSPWGKGFLSAYLNPSALKLQTSGKNRTQKSINSTDPSLPTRQKRHDLSLFPFPSLRCLIIISLPTIIIIVYPIPYPSSLIPHPSSLIPPSRPLSRSSLTPFPPTHTNPRYRNPACCAVPYP
ncbi:hypothetical protein F4778DRAFT_557433 [Xylariomycetidae sp. FL2044]|nr:hypothetical protein F4778DRAFT_557433 [Xylariomycetidae sp. FL2044]